MRKHRWIVILFFLALTTILFVGNFPGTSVFAEVSEEEDMLIEEESMEEEDTPAEDEVMEETSLEETEEASEEEPDYILGREMTEEEVEEQLSMTPELVEMSVEEAVEVSSKGRSAASTRKSNLLRSAAAELPSYLDYRGSYVTSAKNQNPYGICWAYNTISLAETSMLLKGWDFNATDFSEFHLAYYLFNRTSDSLGLTTGDTTNVGEGETYLTNGADNFMTALALSGWMGPVDEEAAPGSWLSLSDPPVSEELAFSSKIKLTDARFISRNSENAVNQIKQAVVDYGSAAIGIYWSNSYLNVQTGAYCIKEKSSGVQNHAVTIVGWDDSYSAANFKDRSEVETDGAWIVKNSWGEDWQDDGFFYISYENTMITDAVVYDFVAEDTYDHNYFYDGSALRAAYSVAEGEKIANIYTASGNEEGAELLTAVNFSLASADTAYQIQLYRDIQNPKDPTSGEEMLTEELTGVTDYPGIYTVSLPETVYLSEGESFSIVITFPNGGSYYAESTKEISSGAVSSTAVTEAGQSFICKNTSWRDLNRSNICARIKGFTVDTEPVDMTTDSLTVRADNNSGTLTLRWSAASGASTYRIYRNIYSNRGSYQYLGSVAADTLSWTDSDLEKGCRYYYKVVPVYDTRPGDCLKLRDGTSYVSAYLSLDIPEIRGSTQDDGNMLLQWEAIPYADAYRIYRMEEGETEFSQIGETKELTYLDASDDVSTYAVYYILAQRSVSTRISSKASNDVMRLGTVTWERVLPKKDRVSLEWTEVTDAQGYEIYRADETSEEWLLTTTDQDTLTYTDENLGESLCYTYRVRAVGTYKGEKITGGYSVIQVNRYPESTATPTPTAEQTPTPTPTTAATPTAELPIEAPTLTAKSTGYQSVKLSWTKASGASGYQILRSTEKNSGFKSVKTIVGGDVLTYINTSLATGTKYYYKIRAYAEGDPKKTYSSYSSVVSATPKLTTPVISKTKEGKKAVRVIWEKTAGASGYQVSRSTKKDQNFQVVKTIKGNSTLRMDDTDVKSGKYYYYRIRAYRKVNGKTYYSSYSRVVRLRLS